MEWARIPPSQCAGLINSYQKCLVAATAAQLGQGVTEHKDLYTTAIHKYVALDHFPNKQEYFSSFT